MGNSPLLGMLPMAPMGSQPVLENGCDPDRGGKRAKTNEAPRERWRDANYERDMTGNTTTRARIGDVCDPTTEPGEPSEALLDQGLAFRQKY